MKWITRERVKVDRVACPWLIRKSSIPRRSSCSCRWIGSWTLPRGKDAYCQRMVRQGKPEGQFRPGSS